MNMRKFWESVFKFSRKKYREEHMNKYHIDIKCPNCNEWFSITTIDYEYERVAEYEWGDSCKCGKCGYISHWNLCAFPFPALSDENGNPVIDKERK